MSGMSLVGCLTFPEIMLSFGPCMESHSWHMLHGSSTMCMPMTTSEVVHCCMKNILLYQATSGASAVKVVKQANLCCYCGQADPALATSTGSAFAADADAHGYRFGVEPVTGLTVYVRSPFQQPFASPVASSKHRCSYVLILLYRNNAVRWSLKACTAW